MEEDTDVELGVGVGVWETGKRGGGEDDRVDRWMVRGVSEPWSKGCPCQSQGSLGD